MMGIEGLIVAGSRNLAHFDAALVAYTFASLFAAYGITYRYALWLQRPPTAVYWRRGFSLFLRRGHLDSHLRLWFVRVGADFAANAFIWKRDRLRGLTHMLLMWGSTLAAAITFPLVFGWIHFEAVAGPTGTGRWCSASPPRPFPWSPSSPSWSSTASCGRPSW